MKFFGAFSSRLLPLGSCSCFQQNQTSICCLSHQWPPQKIELVISCPVLKQSEGSIRSLHSFAQSATSKTWQAAGRRISIIFPGSSFRLPLGFSSLLPGSLSGYDRSPPNRQRACAPPRG